MGIYVETLIRAPMDELLRCTQDPALHEPWDLRFTNISYIPKSDAEDAQRFRYSTRIGFGARITGEGSTTGARQNADGMYTSALQFWSDDPKSLIHDGSGYWQYVPTNDGIRFLTWYDYTTRFGAVGRLFDTFIFRPLMGWATAWSFDRLRLWLERGEHPAVSRDRTVIYAISRLLLVCVFLYHGLVPKLLVHHSDELAMLAQSGVPASRLTVALTTLGVMEIVWGFILLVCWHTRWPLVVTAVAMPIALMMVAVNSPQYLVAAFTPVTLNLLVAGVAIIAWISGRDLPSARRCLRRRPQQAS